MVLLKYSYQAIVITTQRHSQYDFSIQLSLMNVK